MFCTNCGAACSDTAKFCDKCGAALEVAVAQNAPLRPQRPQRNEKQQAQRETTAQWPPQGEQPFKTKRANGCVGQAWDDIIGTPKYGRKMLLLGLISIVPILNFFVYGYALRSAVDATCGKDKLPDKIMETGNFKLGFFWFVMEVIMLLTIALVVGLIAALAGADMTAQAILVVICFALCIVLGFAVAMSCVRIALTNRFSEGFRFKEIFTAIGRKPGTYAWCYFGPILATLAISLGLAVVIAVVGLSTTGVLGGLLSGSSSLQAASVGGAAVLALLVQLFVSCLENALIAFENIFIYRAIGHYINLYVPEWGAHQEVRVDMGSRQPMSVVGGAAAVIDAPKPPARAAAPQPQVLPLTGVAVSAEQGSAETERVNATTNEPAPPTPSPTPQSQQVQAAIFGQKDNDPADGTIVDTELPQTHEATVAETPAPAFPKDGQADSANAVAEGVVRDPSTPLAHARSAQDDVRDGTLRGSAQDDVRDGTLRGSAQDVGAGELSRERTPAPVLPLSGGAVSDEQGSSETERVVNATTKDSAKPKAVIPNPFAIPQSASAKPEPTATEGTGEATVESTAESTLADDVSLDATLIDNDPFEATLIDDSAQEATIIDTAPPASVPTSMRIDREGGGVFMPKRFPCTIGKGSTANFQIIGNDTVSRLHVRIERTSAGYTVEDLGSTNKTYLNGVELMPNRAYPLSNHDVLVLSDERFTVRLS